MTWRFCALFHMLDTSWLNIAGASSAEAAGAEPAEVELESADPDDDELDEDESTAGCCWGGGALCAARCLARKSFNSETIETRQGTRKSGATRRIAATMASSVSGSWAVLLSAACTSAVSLRRAACIDSACALAAAAESRNP